MAVFINNINNANLVIINWNANGLKQNRNTFAAFLNTHNVDIACITETHLINADKIKFNGYVSYRKDRLAARPSGGVVILIKSKIKHQPTFIPVLQSLEAVAITTSINNVITTLICAYQSPSFKMYTNDFEKILCSFQKVMIIGDLNSKHITWNCKTTNQNGRKLHKYLSNTSTIISSPDSPTYYPYDQNRNPDILDIILLKSIPLSIHQEPLFELDSDHLPVKITVGGVLNISTKSRKLINGKPNWEKFKTYITQNIKIPKNINNINSADETTKHFQDIIQRAAEHCSNPSSNTFKNYTQPQIPTSILRMIKIKHQTRKLWQLYRRTEDRKNLNHLTKKVKILLEEHRIASYQNYLSTIHPSDSNLWLATSRLTKPNACVIPPLKLDNVYLSTTVEKCELFAKTLENTFSPNNIPDIETETMVYNKLAEPDILPQNILPYTNPHEINEIIKCLPNRKSPGLDLITNALLKKIPKKAITLLSILFNSLLKIGHFPTEWKKAAVIMIKKPGKDNTNPNSYRPISLLSSVSKIFEKIIYTRLINHLDAIEAIPHHQFGFKPKHSTTQQLLRLTEYINNGFEKKFHTGAAFLDIAQAFDRVWHQGLLYKLKTLNTHSAIFNIIKSFLSDRCFSVRINDTNSGTKKITAGVPQGSKISPLLFNLYIADFPTTSNTEVSLYADDSVVYSSSSDANIVTENIQNHLNIIKCWAKKWKIILNPSKSTAVLFTLRRPKTPTTLVLNGDNISWSTTIKYLGVTLDKKLTWNPHISSKLQQGYQRLKILYPLINRQTALSWNCSLLLYKQILRPLVLYAAPIWGNCAKTHINKIQIFQSKILRTISNAPWFVRNEALHIDFRIPTIKDYIQNLTINFFSQLKYAKSAKYFKLNVKPTFRRLKRGRPHDALPQQQ